MECIVKKFSALIICLLMVITCSLTGCASFSVDKVKYYNEVLATVDETKITRYDLLSAYNSYGNSYFVQQQGQTEEEALKSTLDLLIDRELMYQYALDQGDLYKPTEYQINEIIKDMFDSLDSQMDNYVEEAKSIFNIEDEEDVEDESKEDETAYKIDDYIYSPRAKVKSRIVDGKTEYYIEYIQPKEEPIDHVLNENDRTLLKNFTSKDMVKTIKSTYLEHFFNNLKINEKDNANKLYNKAISLFAEDLIAYEYYLRDENGKQYSKTNDDLIYRYIMRTYESELKSQYIDNIRTYYLKNEPLDIELIANEYNHLVTLNYNTYSQNESAYISKMKDIGTAGDTVLYHPTTDTQFGYFIHTLISFDSIKTQLSALDNILDEEQKETERMNLISQVTVTPRDAETGTILEDSEPVSLADIINEYETLRTKTYVSNEEKMSAFIKFMFKYTGDTATLSSGMPYVVGTNGNSAMEQAFTDEAVALMENRQAGNMSVANIANPDDMCITSYGIHLLYYVGDVNAFDIAYGNDVYIQNTDIVGKEDFNLYTKVINPLTKETYFDMMFDLIYPNDSDEIYSTNNGYTDHEESLKEQSKKSHTVTKYTTKINATKTSI